VCNLDIKIVGAVTDENGLEEIENIAKVFAYEQRMKDYTSLLYVPQQKTEGKKSIDKKMGETSRFIQNTQPRNLVKGLC
jgi:hypothetical protein